MSFRGRQASSQGEETELNASLEPIGRPGGQARQRFVLAVAAPLAVVALAYALWWISDRLLYVGPLDRATFGWLVVIPVFVAAPILAGLIWRRLPPRSSALAAAVVAATITAVAAVLFWQAVAYPDCEYSAIRAPLDWVLPSLILGAVIGGGLAASGLVASRFARQGRPWRAAFAGVALEVVAVFAAILVGAGMLIGTGCQRPPV
jgi:hypothetical protein